MSTFYSFETAILDSSDFGDRSVLAQFLHVGINPVRIGPSQPRLLLNASRLIFPAAIENAVWNCEGITNIAIWQEGKKDLSLIVYSCRFLSCVSSITRGDMTVATSACFMSDSFYDPKDRDAIRKHKPNRKWGLNQKRILLR